MNFRLRINCFYLCILSVYSPFYNRVGLPLHSITSQFISVMDILFVDRKFCHVRFYTLQPCPSWSSAFKLHTFLFSISSELPICGGGACSILLLPLVVRCLETIDVCIWRMFVVMPVVVTVWGFVGMFVL